MNKLILLMMIVFCPIVVRATEEYFPWQARHAEGWAWYHDRECEVEKIEEPPKDPVVILQQTKADLDRSLAAAMVEPTHENVAAYMALQQKMIQQAALFSRVWQQNLLEYPELSSQHPTTQYGVQARKQFDDAKKKSLIKTLAKNQTLLFFYEGRNPYSQAFSKVVYEFCNQYNWTIKAVSIDGIVTKEFPHTIRDGSVAREMEVIVFPALYLVDMSTLNGTPIAFGMVTISQIEDNILMQFEG